VKRRRVAVLVVVLFAVLALAGAAGTSWQWVEHVSRIRIRRSATGRS
jgi:hypothetical protein